MCLNNITSDLRPICVRFASDSDKDSKCILTEMPGNEKMECVHRTISNVKDKSDRLDINPDNVDRSVSQYEKKRSGNLEDI